MAKLRHIAITVPDPWKAAEFYMRAFGLQKVGETDWENARGVYLSDGTTRRTDHVLLSTGYAVDVTRVPFLPGDIARDLTRIGGFPRLDAGFQSSVPGLHFVGASAARSFGPLMRFVAGTGFAARRLARGIERAAP